MPKLILEAELDNGVVALGECHRGHDWAVVAEAAARLVGTRLDRFDRQAPPIPEGPERIGFECLVWDGIAKSHDLPLVELFGGRARERVPVAAWSGHRTSEDAGRVARTMAAAGHTHLKLKCDLRDDVVSICREVAAPAPELKLTLDPNERWGDVAEARRRLDGLEPVGNVHCVEDPIPHEMLEGYRDAPSHEPDPHRVPYRAAARSPPGIGSATPSAPSARTRWMRSTSPRGHRPSRAWRMSPRPPRCRSGSDPRSTSASSRRCTCTWPRRPPDRCGPATSSDVSSGASDLLQSPLRLVPPWVDVPEGPGLGVALDADALSRHTTRREEFA